MGTQCRAHTSPRSRQLILRLKSQFPHYWLRCSQCPVSKVFCLPNWRSMLLFSTHLLNPYPENLKMVYFSHQSALLHSRSSSGAGTAARARHSGFWLKILAPIITWIYPHQPPVLLVSISHPLSTGESEKIKFRINLCTTKFLELKEKGYDGFLKVYESLKIT